MCTLTPEWEKWGEKATNPNISVSGAAAIMPRRRHLCDCYTKKWPVLVFNIKSMLYPSTDCDSNLITLLKFSPMTNFRRCFGVGKSVRVN